MNCKLITTASDLSHPGLQMLRKSLDKYNWPYEVISSEYQAYGSKMVNAYKYAKSCNETHLFIVDAYDVVVFDTMDKAIERMPKGKIVFNAEKSCWPYSEWVSRYPECNTPYRFLNGGCAFVEVQEFIRMFEENPIAHGDNDQVNLAEIYLSGKYDFVLDTNCEVFQTYCHVEQDEFGQYMHNLKTGTEPIFIHGNGGTNMQPVYDFIPMKLNEYKWEDTPESHQRINETFAASVNRNDALKTYRDWIEQKIFGFGERSFLWMWKCIINELPDRFSFLEIGVFKGQILGAVRMLAPFADITGITPLNSAGTNWDSDYLADIKHLHDTFGLQYPNIIEGYSTDCVDKVGMYDVIYIDGDHSYEGAKFDIINYSPKVLPGGFLVIDDCACKYKMPFGYFTGIESVSRAVDELLPNEYFQEVFSVVHNRVFKRVK